MLGKMKVEPASDGDSVADGVSVMDTPGHTKGHISVLLESGGDKVLVAGDALPDSGTVKRKLSFMVCWDVDDAAESVEKTLDASRVFYPGHDRPFRLDGEEISYLHEPTAVEVRDTNKGGGAALTFRVIAKRPVNIDTVQKR